MVKHFSTVVLLFEYCFTNVGERGIFQILFASVFEYCFITVRFFLRIHFLLLFVNIVFIGLLFCILFKNCLSLLG